PMKAGSILRMTGPPVCFCCSGQTTGRNRTPQRKAKKEPRALSGSRLDPHIAAVFQDGLPRERESKAEAVALARADERLKQLGANLRRDAGSVVADFDERRVTIELRGDADFAAIRHRL